MDHKDYVVMDHRLCSCRLCCNGWCRLCSNGQYRLCSNGPHKHKKYLTEAGLLSNKQAELWVAVKDRKDCNEEVVIRPIEHFTVQYSKIQYDIIHNKTPLHS